MSLLYAVIVVIPSEQTQCYNNTVIMLIADHFQFVTVYPCFNGSGRIGQLSNGGIFFISR